MRFLGPQNIRYDCLNSTRPFFHFFKNLVIPVPLSPRRRGCPSGRTAGAECPPRCKDRKKRGRRNWLQSVKNAGEVSTKARHISRSKEYILMTFAPLHENLMKPDLKNRNIWSVLVISKGNPAYFLERNRLVRSLERDQLRIVSIWTVFDSIFL